MDLIKITCQNGTLLNFLGLLVKVGLPLMNNKLIPFVKSVLVPSGLTRAASATDTTIQKNLCIRGNTLIISDEEMNYTMKIAKFSHNSSLLLAVINETIRRKKAHFLVCY